jgi:hypothetical protein
LTIACQHNQLLLDVHVRGLHEIEGIQKGFTTSNPVINIGAIFTKSGDGFYADGFTKEKSRIVTNMQTEVAQCFYAVNGRKAKLRPTV